MNDDLELTPAERAEFARLPREASPSPQLWERVVRTLRADGTLQSGAGARRSPAGAAAAPVAEPGFPALARPLATADRWMRPWALAGAAMAASLVLFVSGMLLGHWIGTTSTERAFRANREHDSAQLAQRTQDAGTAYVSALVALAGLQAASARPAAGATRLASAEVAFEIRQGKEAALGALYGATFELAKVAPGDPDVSRILGILEERRLGGSPDGGERHTVSY